MNALQRRSLERELHILDRVRHGAIIRAGAIVEDAGGNENPIPMLYIEVRVRVVPTILSPCSTWRWD